MSSMDKDNKNIVTGGIKVTYIETRFVTSDEAGFKDLVQRLTGRSSSSSSSAPHRPRPYRPDVDGRPQGTSAAGAAAAVPQGYHQYTAAAEVRPAVTISHTPTTTYLEAGMGLDDFIDMGDFSDLLYVGAASYRSDGGCYGGSFPY